VQMDWSFLLCPLKQPDKIHADSDFIYVPIAGECYRHAIRDEIIKYDAWPDRILWGRIGAGRFRHHRDRIQYERVGEFDLAQFLLGGSEEINGGEPTATFASDRQWVEGFQARHHSMESSSSNQFILAETHRDYSRRRKQAIFLFVAIKRG